MITNLHFTLADRLHHRSGLLGFVSFSYGDLRLDGITVRQTATGRYALSFPERTDSTGQRHAIFRPIDDDARRAIEAEVLAAIGLEQPAGQP